MSTDFRTEPPWQKEGIDIPPEYTIVARAAVCHMGMGV